MDRKVMEALRVMFCEELEEIAKKGTLTHEILDMAKDLLDAMKNLEKIEKYQKEKDKEWEMGYSQRKYYIDADYDPYGPRQSYAYPNMPHLRGARPYMDGNSYMYPMYEQPMGYARTTSTQELVQELKGIYIYQYL